MSTYAYARTASGRYLGSLMCTDEQTDGEQRASVPVVLDDSNGVYANNIIDDVESRPHTAESAPAINSKPPQAMSNISSVNPAQDNHIGAYLLLTLNPFRRMMTPLRVGKGKEVLLQKCRCGTLSLPWPPHTRPVTRKKRPRSQTFLHSLSSAVPRSLQPPQITLHPRSRRMTVCCSREGVALSMTAIVDRVGDALSWT